MKTTKIYRLVEVQNGDEAKFYGNKFYGSKEAVENAIATACFSPEHGGRNVHIADWVLHKWDSVKIEGEGWMTCTFSKIVTINDEMFGEKYTKKFSIVYVTYEMEA